MRTPFAIERQDIPRFLLWIAAGLLLILGWPWAIQRVLPDGEYSLGHLVGSWLSDWTLYTEHSLIRPIGELIDITLFAGLLASSQWLILRHRFPASAAWGVATFVGVVLGACASRVLFEVFPQQQVFLDEARTTYTYRLATGYALLSSIITSLLVSLCQFAVLWKRVKYAHGWVVMAVLTNGLLQLLPADQTTSSIAIAAGIVIDAYVIFLLLRNPLSAPAAPVTSVRPPAHPYRWGVTLIASGIAIKLLGVLISSAMRRGPYPDGGLRGMLQMARDANASVKVQATSDILLVLFLLVGIYLIIRRYRATRGAT